MRVCPPVRRNRLNVAPSPGWRSCSPANLLRRPLGQQAAFKMSPRCQINLDSLADRQLQHLAHYRLAAGMASTVADLRTLAVAPFCNSDT